jgi:hypothetical protein
MLNRIDIENIMLESPYDVTSRFSLEHDEIYIFVSKIHIATIDNGNTYSWIADSMSTSVQKNFELFHDVLKRYLNGKPRDKLVEYTPEKGWQFE